jgi:type II secretory pathway pseudopilin PulG
MTTRSRDPEAGVTVVEMVVVIALLSLVLALVFQSVASYQGAAAGSDARLQNLDEARVIMAVLTRDLRTATTFCPSTPACPGAVFERDDVTFLGFLETTAAGGATASLPSEIRLYVDGQGQLVEVVTPPDDPSASPLTYDGTPTTRVVGRHLVDHQDRLFTFYDDQDPPQEVTSPTSVVANVAISLSVRVPSAESVPATVLESQVWLPNVAMAGTGA